MAHPLDGQHQEGAGTAGRVQQPLAGITGYAHLIQQPLGQPVGGVVLAQVVSQLLGHQVLVELLQQVTGLLRVYVQRHQRVIGQVTDDAPEGVLDRRVPDIQVPAKEVTFQEVLDAEVGKDSAPLHLVQVSLQAGCICRGHLGQAGAHLGHQVVVGNLDRQQLDEDGVVGVDGKEEMQAARLWVVHAI